VYLKVRIGSANRCKEFGMPELPFGHLRLGKEGWEKVPIDEYPGARRINLLLKRPTINLPETHYSGHISLEAKQKIDHVDGIVPYNPSLNQIWLRQCERISGVDSKPLVIHTKAVPKSCMP
jgi:hypothetical protein